MSRPLTQPVGFRLRISGTAQAAVERRQADLVRTRALRCAGNPPGASRQNACHAEEVLWHELQPGEHIVSSVAVTSNPSRWVTAVFLALAAGQLVVGLIIIFGPGTDAGTAGLLSPLLPLGVVFLRRPVLLAVTSQRLICLRLSRLRRVPGRLDFAVPLMEVRVVKYRPGKYAAAIQFETPGRKRTWLNVGLSGRKNFTTIEATLTRAGAFTKLDPPWPSATIS